VRRRLDRLEQFELDRSIRGERERQRRRTKEERSKFWLAIRTVRSAEVADRFARIKTALECLMRFSLTVSSLNRANSSKRLPQLHRPFSLVRALRWRQSDSRRNPFVSNSAKVPSHFKTSTDQLHAANGQSPFSRILHSLLIFHHLLSLPRSSGQ
jgi:hypothetical protein